MQNKSNGKKQERIISGFDMRFSSNEIAQE